jgi:thioredoxin reductase (NADPH)
MHKLIIIGSGPAGLTAAIYAARAQLEPMIIEGQQPGGQLTTTTIVENWPGAPKGIDGQQLMADMREQALKFGCAFKGGEVTALNLSSRPFALTVESQNLAAESLIIATGASPRLLGLESERRLMGRGVSVCATCDGFFFKGKDVLVVGGGDTAIEEAIFLSALASTVTVVHRRNELRAEKIMQRRAFQTSNIRFLWDSVIADISDPAQGSVSGALIRNVQTGADVFQPCHGIFIALGHTPNTGLCAGQIELNAQGFIATRRGTATNIPGVFAAGDVADPVYKQAVTAAATGCMAALDVEKYLQGI